MALTAIFNKIIYSYKKINKIKKTLKKKDD